MVLETTVLPTELFSFQSIQMLYRYFFEIKSRILLIIISWIITILICYCYKEILLFLLVKLNVKLYSLNSFYFISTNLIDVFSVYLQLSYFISTQFSIAILFSELFVLLQENNKIGNNRVKMFSVFITDNL